MNSLLFSRCAFGFAIFAAFSLSVCWLGDGHQVAFLLESAWSWVIWCVVGAGAVSVLAVRTLLSQRQFIGLGVLYALMPFTITWSLGQSTLFLLLPGHILLAVFYWFWSSVYFGLSFRGKLIRPSATVLILLVISAAGVFCQESNRQKIVYDWYPPQGSTNFPAVLVIGGSEGGKNYGQQWAKILNSKGFGVMALAYFGVEGLPKQLEEIPLEYFQAAFDSVKTFQGVNANKLGVISMSKGTEAALLLAADNPALKLLVAASPSHAVWQGINRADYSSVKSSWLKNSKPYPFLKYDYSRGYFPVINFYLGALEKPVNQDAVIPVEKIKGTIILLSGGKDQVWPSSKMATEIKNRRSDKNNTLIYKDFPNAGHGFLMPYQSEEEARRILNGIKPNLNFLGGNIEAFEEAMKESLLVVIAELSKLQVNEQ